MKADLPLTKIDELVALDKQVKDLEAKIKVLKAEVVNTFGEGKHNGLVYSVNVILAPTSSTNWKAIAKEFSIPAEAIEKHTKRDACIKVYCEA
jgi:uncharacterized protein YaaN involved in tellurite resistance